MSTIHLVDPAARDVVAAVESFDPVRDGLNKLRDDVTSQGVGDPLSRQETVIAGPAGAPDVRVLIYRPEHSEGLSPAVLSLHGGGFIAGTPDKMDGANAKLATKIGAIVVAVTYRLAPETTFPGPVEDCYVALAWLFGEAEALGVDNTRIAILGRSAGGGLGAALALLVRDRGEFSLKAQLLIYPMLDPRTGTKDAPIDNPFTGEFVWTRAANRFSWNALRGSSEIPAERLGHFAPALAKDVAGLPATFIAVGSLDLFLEEDIAFALRLARVGIPVEAHIYPGGVHGFDAFPGALADEFNADLYAAMMRFLRS
jgi:acetyl esterase/lipase